MKDVQKLTGITQIKYIIFFIPKYISVGESNKQLAQNLRLVQSKRCTRDTKAKISRIEETTGINYINTE